jgi:hypothetical protein
MAGSELVHGTLVAKRANPIMPNGVGSSWSFHQIDGEAQHKFSPEMTLTIL